MIGHCVEALSKCARCSGSHHTTMHDEVQIIRKAREDRIAKMKPKRPEVNSPKERMNRMGLNADVEHGDEDSVDDAAQYCREVASATTILEIADNSLKVIYHGEQRIKLQRKGWCNGYSIRKQLRSKVKYLLGPSPRISWTVGLD